MTVIGIAFTFGLAWYCLYLYTLPWLKTLWDGDTSLLNPWNVVFGLATFVGVNALLQGVQRVLTLIP